MTRKSPSRYLTSASPAIGGVRSKRFNTSNLQEHARAGLVGRRGWRGDNIVARARAWYPPDCDRVALRLGPFRAKYRVHKKASARGCHAMLLTAALLLAGTVAFTTVAGAAEQIAIPHGDTTLPGVLFRPEAAWPV